MVWLTALGGLLILVGYLLPFFPNRITQATTRFADGTAIVVEADGLLAGQKYNQTRPQPKTTLEDVQIVVAPTEGGSSGWAWLWRIGTQTASLGQQAGLVITLAIPLVAAVCLLALGAATLRRGTLPTRWIAPGANVAFLAVACLPLAWAHSFDFSERLYSLAEGALAPGAGLFVALAGALAAAWALWSLRGETLQRVFSWWHLVFAVAFLIWFLTKVRPYPFLEIWLFIADGILVTLRLVATSFVFILIVSLLGGLGRISKNRVIYAISSLYVELIRGIPLLVQLLFIWFALPQVLDGFGNALAAMAPSLQPQAEAIIAARLDPYAAAVLGLTICYGAYGSEVFRAGISSIHHGQVEAARSLGMTPVQAMRYVILPQAVRVILPPVGNEFVALLKDSSLVSVLAVSDLTRRGREYMARTFLSFDTWILVALCYLVLTLFSSRVVEHIESKSKFER